MSVRHADYTGDLRYLQSPIWDAILLARYFLWHFAHVTQPKWCVGKGAGFFSGTSTLALVV